MVLGGLRWFCSLRLFGLGGVLLTYVVWVVLVAFAIRAVGLPSCFRFLWDWYNIGFGWVSVLGYLRGLGC